MPEAQEEDRGLLGGREPAEGEAGERGLLEGRQPPEGEAGERGLLGGREPAEGEAGERGVLGGRQPPECELTRMRWWHIEPLLGLERELFGEESWSAAAFWNELAESNTRHYVVALLGGEIVGYAGLAVTGDEAHVLTIGVTRRVQRGGIGTALLRDLLAAAGSRRVLLDVRVDNGSAQRLYERHGFVPVGRRRRYYQPSGTDALVMAREPASSRTAT